MNSDVRHKILDSWIETGAYKEKTYQQKEVIVYKNKLVKKVYLIREGFVKASCFNEKGYEMIGALLTKNQTFGTSFLVQGTCSNFTFTAVKKTVLFEFELSHLLKLKMHRSHQILQLLLKQEYTEIEKRIKTLHHRSSKKRLVSSLHELQEKSSVAIATMPTKTMNYPFNQNELADYTRTSRVTTNTLINRMKKTPAIHVL